MSATTTPTGTTGGTKGLASSSWETKRLGDHVTFLRTGTNSRAELSTDDPVKYLHYGDIHTSSRVCLDLRTIELPSLAKERARLLDRLRDGDLVFVDASEDLDGVGKSVEIAGTSGRELVAGLHTIAARFDKAVLADGFKAYLQFAPTLREQLRRLAAGTKVYATSRAHIASAEIQLPGIREQRAIAEVLSDVDGLIESLDALIAKKRVIKQGAMQQLLTGRTRLPGFSGEWETKRLGDVLSVRHGRSQRAVVKEDGKYPILATGGEIGRTDAALFAKPSVLIGRKGTIDEPQYVDSPFWTVDTLFYTEIGREAVPKFIYYQFLMVPWRNHNEASGVPSLNARTIERISILLPGVEEQTAIATVLSDMDAEIAALEQRRDKVRDIKQGMMQQLLTGRIRLVEPEHAEAGT